MFLILSDNPAAVFEHDPQGGRVADEHPQINFLLRHNAVRLFQGHVQAFGSVSLPPVRFADELADMAGTGTKGLAQVMADPELADDGIIIPEEEESFRHISFRKSFSFRKGDHFRQGLFRKILPGNVMPGVCQAVFILRHIPDKQPFLLQVFQAGFFRYITGLLLCFQNGREAGICRAGHVLRSMRVNRAYHTINCGERTGSRRKDFFSILPVTGIIKQSGKECPKMIIEEIRAELSRLQDTTYREMQVRIIPTVKPESIIGVRTPSCGRWRNSMRRTQTLMCS